MVARRRGKPQPALAALVSTLLALLHNSSASRASFYGLLLSGAVVASAARPGGVADFPDYEQPRALSSSVDSSKELSAVEESVSRQLWGEYNVTVSLLSGDGTDDQAVRVSAIELETSNVFRAELTAANLSSLGFTFRTVGQVYDFLGQSLAVTLPKNSAAGASAPGSLTSSLWKSEATGNVVVYTAKLEPEYIFLEAITVTLQLELVKEGTSEERYAYLMQQLAERFQRVNSENTLRFENQISALSQTVNLMKTQLNGRIFIKGMTIPIDIQLPADLTSDELMPLTICANITYLDLSHAELTHLDFLPSLPKLETLILKSATAITNLNALRTLTRLQTLDLTGCSGISDVGLLNQLPALRKVTLTGTSVINSQTLIDPQLEIVGP
eukprot:jgi/Tetstr1/459397/TSEL_004776.t1